MADFTNEIKKRRTFAIISHPDAGKTTLTEKFLLYGGAINQAGSVKGKATAKHAVSDWMEIEKERGISVTSSVLQFQYDGYCINILDTPGYFDFVGEVEEAVSAADAAVIVVLFSVSYFSYWRGGISIKEVFSDIIVEAPLGSRTKLTLPDGTLVWLNAGSRITYSQGFGVGNRKIELIGEGYFEVKRNEEVPFLVKTNSLLVKVLGTKFNFRDYPDDAEAIVSLSEGKVALNNLLKKEKEAFLLPNERVVLNKKNGRMHVEYSTVSNALQWTNGYLFFDEELLPDVVKELERSYNVKIQIASDTLNTFRFYGNFVHREQNIQEVLEALSATRKIHYIIEGHNITLY